MGSISWGLLSKMAVARVSVQKKNYSGSNMKDRLVMTAREGTGPWGDWRRGDGNQVKKQLQ